MKELVKSVVVVLLVAFAVTSVYAAQGNPKKGKFLYKKNCKSCHVKGGPSVELTPLSKTMNQWDRFFEEDHHKVNPEPFQGLTQGDLVDIRQFLRDHAMDSPTPQTCG